MLIMKKLIKIAFVAAFAAIAGYGVYTNQKAEPMSDLMLANVEALADCEIVKGGSVKLKCTGDGSCSKSYLGYTLTCDGTEVK